MHLGTGFAFVQIAGLELSQTLFFVFWLAGVFSFEKLAACFLF